MTVPTDVLRKIADTSPYPAGRYGQLGASGMIQRLEDAGMMGFLVQRSYTERQAHDMCADAQFPSRELERTFYRGHKNYYLCADMDRNTGSRFADAAIARIKQYDPEAAQEYREVLTDEGAQGLFRQIGVDIKRADLAAVAKQERPVADLASVEEMAARRGRGRAM